MIRPPTKPMMPPSTARAESHRTHRPALIADQQKFDQQDSEKDCERIVGAGLDFKRRAHARAQPQPARLIRKNTAAASVDATTAPTSSACIQLMPSDQLGDRRGQRGGDQHADGRQHHRRREHVAESGEARAQAAVEQDQRKRNRTDRIGGVDVVEFDPAGTALARPACRPAGTPAAAARRSATRPGSTECRQAPAGCRAVSRC